MPLRGSLIFFVRSPHDDLQSMIRQRSLERLCFIPWSAHPDIPLFIRRQDDRHRLGMDWLDNCIRRRREEAIDVMRTRDRLRFRAAVTLELGPDAREAG